MFSVRVVDDDQKGVSGIRVTLEFTDVTRGMSDEVYTDNDGYAEFDGYDDGEVVVYVDGSNAGAYRYENGGSITITR